MRLINLQPVSNLSAFKKPIMASKAEWDGSMTCSEGDEPSPGRPTALGEMHEGARKCLLNEVPACHL